MADDDTDRSIAALQTALSALILALGGLDHSKELDMALEQLGLPHSEMAWTMAGSFDNAIRSRLTGQLDAYSNNMAELSRFYVHAQERFAALDEAGDDARRQRYITVDVYADGNNADHSALLAGIEQFIYDMQFDIAVDPPSQLGSIRKHWIAYTNRPTIRRELAEGYDMAKRALELNHLDHGQADIDERYIRMTAGLARAMADYHSVALKFGSLLFIKTTEDGGRVHLSAVTLTARQILALQRHPELLWEPAKTLVLLAEYASDVETDGDLPG